MRDERIEKLSTTSIFYVVLYDPSFVNNYLFIKTVPSEWENKAPIYLTKSETEVTPSSSSYDLYSSSVGVNSIYAVSKINCNYYIGVYCEKDCDFKIYVEKRSRFTFSPEEDLNLSWNSYDDSLYILQHFKENHKKMAIYIFVYYDRQNTLEYLQAQWGIND